MELRHLRYFLAVADAGSMTVAAERLRIARPSLSRQVRDLERALGRELMERSASGVRLTAAGRALYEQARRFVGLEECTTALVRRAGEVDDSVSVGLAPGLSHPDLATTGPLLILPWVGGVSLLGGGAALVGVRSML